MKKTRGRKSRWTVLLKHSTVYGPLMNKLIEFCKLDPLCKIIKLKTTKFVCPCSQRLRRREIFALLLVSLLYVYIIANTPIRFILPVLFL